MRGGAREDGISDVASGAGADAVGDVGLRAGGVHVTSVDGVTEDTADTTRGLQEVLEQVDGALAEGAVDSEIAVLGGVEALGEGVRG